MGAFFGYFINQLKILVRRSFFFINQILTRCHSYRRDFSAFRDRMTATVSKQHYPVGLSLLTLASASAFEDHTKSREKDKPICYSQLKVCWLLSALVYYYYYKIIIITHHSFPFFCFIPFLPISDEVSYCCRSLNMPGINSHRKFHYSPKTKISPLPKYNHHVLFSLCFLEISSNVDSWSHLVIVFY